MRVVAVLSSADGIVAVHRFGSSCYANRAASDVLGDFIGGDSPTANWTIATWAGVSTDRVRFCACARSDQFGG